MAPARKEYGLTVLGIFRKADDENTIMLLIDVADINKARAFARSQVLARGREQALKGEQTEAEVWFSDTRITVA